MSRTSYENGTLNTEYENGMLNARYEFGTLIITLEREGNYRPYSFEGYQVEIEKTRDPYVMQSLGLTGQADADGFVRYIYAVSKTEIGVEFAVRITEQEAEVLPKAIFAAWRRQWR